jgi:hypothetical protein
MFRNILLIFVFSLFFILAACDSNDEHMRMDMEETMHGESPQSMMDIGNMMNHMLLYYDLINFRVEL